MQDQHVFNLNLIRQMMHERMNAHESYLRKGPEKHIVDYVLAKKLQEGLTILWTIEHVVCFRVRLDEIVCSLVPLHAVGLVSGREPTIVITGNSYYLRLVECNPVFHLQDILLKFKS